MQHERIQQPNRIQATRIKIPDIVPVRKRRHAHNNQFVIPEIVARSQADQRDKQQAQKDHHPGYGMLFHLRFDSFECRGCPLFRRGS